MGRYWINNKKQMRQIITIILAAFSTMAFSQGCDCESIFNWTKKTFEENDAGFDYILAKKGEAAYELHNQLILQQIKEISTPIECRTLVRTWLLFFRKSHLQFHYTGEVKNQPEKEDEQVGNNMGAQETSDKSQSNELHLKFLNTDTPFIERLNSKTLYLRIPSFHGTAKPLIDSLISINRTKILQTEHLIIDIRNGTGGNDDSYEELLPFIYTNPIRLPTVEFRSTPLNNQRMYDLATNTGFALEQGVNSSTEEMIKFQADYDTLNHHLGEFVNLKETTISEIKLDTIYPYPKQVGILINENNVSTDEQFILEAKQSKKVKLFGRTTKGGLDISNLYLTFSPQKDFVLVYGLSKSLRIPEMVVDDIGVMPDFYIDKSIPEFEWINYVNEILNQ